MSNLNTAMTKRKPWTKIIDGIPRDPHYDPERFKEVLKFRPGKADLVFMSYPKAGAHWLLYTTQLILKRGEPVNSYQEFSKDMRYLGALDHEAWVPSLPLRLFQTHLPPRKETMTTEAKYVYVARNPWDVAVSLFHMVTNLSTYRFQDGSFDELIDVFLSDDVAGHGSYFDHVVAGYAIKDATNVFFVTYEGLMEDTRGTTLKLAHFLGEDYGRELEQNNQLLQELLTRCEASQMREAMILCLDENSDPDIRRVLETNNESCKEGYQGDKKRYSFVREAKIGGWKKYFSPEQLQRMEAAIKMVEDRSPVMELWRNIRDEALSASGLG